MATQPQQPAPNTRTRQRPAPAQPEPKRMLDLTAHEGSVMVTRTAYGVTNESTEKVRVAFFGDIKPAYVSVGGSVTRNLGDYNSCKVDVRISMPCLPEMSEVQRVYEMLSAKLDELIPQELSNAVGGEAQG